MSFCGSCQTVLWAFICPSFVSDTHAAVVITHCALSRMTKYRFVALDLESHHSIIQVTKLVVKNLANQPIFLTPVFFYD